MNALLAHLEARGFAGAPRPRGFDAHGREVLTYLPGDTVGEARPWPTWTRSDGALVAVAAWLRAYHDAVADFRPPPDAVWREGGRWREGMIVGHGDPAPYNAVWRAGRLVGFFDWDFAGPTTRPDDVAWTAFSWVPLHARHVVAAEGFTAFAGRGRRLQVFLDAYGWTGEPAAFLGLVRRRVLAAADALRRTAAAGDPAYEAMLARGVDASLKQAADELIDLG